ncbi:zinc finger C2HC domain-containing protein 1A-like isoform X2 [Ptychodera flava]|uniref:zinc finger C2HC domain-containing protein 1A-like isoform X2 n=1 Tax=Ptychodera flava TaxID=63121 RepID=UPI00396A90BE
MHFLLIASIENTIMAAALARGEAGPLNPCRYCGRTFNPTSHVKHERICQRMQFKKRPIFDSGRQRASGSDIPFGATLRPGRRLQTTGSKNNWRARHKEFIETIRNARAAVRAMRRGDPLPPPPPPADNPDYVYCTSCHRSFNPNAAKRHIPMCKARKRERGEPVSYLGRSVGQGYGSKISTGREPRIKSASFHKRGNVNEKQKKSTSYHTNQPIVDPFHDVPYNYDTPIPTRKSVGPVSNSTVFPANGFMGSTSPRIYQDQPCVFSSTGLTPAVVHGNSYEPSARFSQGFGKPRSISAKYRHMNSRKPSNDNTEMVNISDGFHINLPPMSPQHNSPSRKYTSKATPRYGKTRYGIGALSKSTEGVNVNVDSHCHRCGDSYPDMTTRFCCNCGVQRSLGFGMVSGVH